jgi:hypothetical protein
VATLEKRLSAKELQLEINRSRKRWMTLLSITAGLGVLLLASMIGPFQHKDRDDAERANGAVAQETRRAID